MDAAAETVAFDHLIHAVPDLDAAVAAYRAAGFPAAGAPPGSTAGLGFRNGSWVRDTRYVELLTVDDPAAFRSSPYGPHAADLLPDVAAATAAGGGALGIGVVVPDVRAAVDRLRATGRPAEFLTITLARGGGTVSYQIGWLTAGPPWRPLVLKYPGTPEQRRARFRQRGKTQAPFDLRAVVIETPSPTDGAAWLAAGLGLRAVAGAGGSWRVPLPGGEIRLVAGPAERVTEVLLGGADGRDVTDAPEATLAGLRYRRATAAPSAP